MKPTPVNDTAASKVHIKRHNHNPVFSLKPVDCTVSSDFGSCCCVLSAFYNCTSPSPLLKNLQKVTMQLNLFVKLFWQLALLIGTALADCYTDGSPWSVIGDENAIDSAFNGLCSKMAGDYKTGNTVSRGERHRGRKQTE